MVNWDRVHVDHAEVQCSDDVDTQPQDASQLSSLAELTITDQI